jgi:hypothetical protein
VQSILSYRKLGGTIPAFPALERTARGAAPEARDEGGHPLRPRHWLGNILARADPERLRVFAPTACE